MHVAEIDQLPIPAAIACCDGARVTILGANAQWLLLRLGPQLDERLDAAGFPERLLDFDRSRSAAAEFAWQDGDEVDTRHYRVHLSRTSAQSGEPVLITLIDRTSELRTEHHLRREMLTDALSGLPNRAGFAEVIEGVLRDDADVRARYAVMIVNLDRFSRVNACLGALAGDELLITVARRIRGALRAHDVLARLGGDEFAILLALDGGRADVDHVAKRVIAAFAAPYRLSDFEIRVSCSIGIAFGADLIADNEDLIRHAQFAAKRSKASGAVESYQPHAFDAARAQFSIETALRHAIDDAALDLAFQPIVDLATGRIASFEALARWRADDGTEICPSEFIPVAEESGLIVPLGQWVLSAAARTLTAWDALSGGDCGVRVAVNVSAIQLQRDNIPHQVERVLGAAGLPGHRLTLELTESALVSDSDRISQTMHALRALGVTLAMDDFGTGYSNLTYLQKLPIDVLKMDRSFVTGMLADRDKVAIVRAIMGLAQALGMKTTAEGVETHEVAQTLAALGCSYGQGYFYGRALDADAAYALLTERNA